MITQICFYWFIFFIPIRLRGNVGTRLQRLADGHYDAIILASAGLIRLGLADRMTHMLDTEVCLPAIGQGAVGIECRASDARVGDLIAALGCRDTQICVSAERALNRRLEGGCQVPIAGHATLDRGLLQLCGLVGQPDGSEIVRGERSGASADAEQLGVALAEELLERGAATILRNLYAGV